MGEAAHPPAYYLDVDTFWVRQEKCTWPDQSGFSHRTLKLHFLAMKYFYGLLVLSSIFCGSKAEVEELEVKKRNIGLFNVVRFRNDACQGTGGKNGTCYSEEDCKNRGGESKGSCAEGYGVCCVFTMGCGGTKSENLTYFDSMTSYHTGSCNAKICKCTQKVCQLRLDFETFVIAGPSTQTTTNSKMFGGMTHATGQAVVSGYGVCVTDSFGVSGALGKTSSPNICGTNSGYHIYVEASDACNVMYFSLDGQSSFTRAWNIRVTQYDCNHLNAAPTGCLQYFFNQDSKGVLESFNKANNVHLANQNQVICIRREFGNCRICYFHAPNDFAVSASMENSGFVGKNSKCCNAGTDAMSHSNYDCVIIPNPTGKENRRNVPSANGNFCGDRLVATSGQAADTICSMITPFIIRFISDGAEGSAMEKMHGNAGFKLYYQQYGCT